VRMISQESLRGLQLKAAGIIVALVAVLGLMYSFLVPGDQVPWVGPQDTVTVTVEQPQITYPPASVLGR
jgi:hypothetical protein